MLDDVGRIDKDKDNSKSVLYFNELIKKIQESSSIQIYNDQKMMIYDGKYEYRVFLELFYKILTKSHDVVCCIDGCENANICTISMYEILIFEESKFIVPICYKHNKKFNGFYLKKNTILLKLENN